MRMRALIWLVLVAGLLPAAAPARAAGALTVVAAENIYGDIAAQIGGADVRVTSILTNPDDDPHLFEASPTVARAIANAAIAVENGVDYDPWMGKLLGAAGSAGRDVIVVGDLVHRVSGDNPHLWYDVAAVTGFAKAFAAELERRDPAHAGDYDRRSRSFSASLAPLEARIAAMKARFAGAPVAATEPVFGYMAQALGLVMRNERFQLAVMNNAEPAASDVAAFENDLRSHRVRVLLYNTQATDEQARRLLGIARQAGVPVAGVSETEPPGKTYQAWMEDQLDALDQALSRPAS